MQRERVFLNQVRPPLSDSSLQPNCLLKALPGGTLCHPTFFKYHTANSTSRYSSFHACMFGIRLKEIDSNYIYCQNRPAFGDVEFGLKWAGGGEITIRGSMLITYRRVPLLCKVLAKRSHASFRQTSKLHKFLSNYLTSQSVTYVSAKRGCAVLILSASTAFVAVLQVVSMCIMTCLPALLTFVLLTCEVHLTI